MILGKQMFQLSLLDFDIKNIFAQILTFENEQIALNLAFCVAYTKSAMSSLITSLFVGI